MSTSSIFFPFLRRSWTCRACLRSQRQTTPHRQVLWQQRTAFAQQSAACASTVAKDTNRVANAATKVSGKNSKRRRRLLITGGGLAIGAAAITINDDAKHAYTAAQRSYRVLGTLVLNIKEYVKCRAVWTNGWLTTRTAQLSYYLEARHRTRLPRTVESLPFTMRETNSSDSRKERLDLYQARTTSEQHELLAAE